MGISDKGEAIDAIAEQFREELDGHPVNVIVFVVGQYSYDRCAEEMTQEPGTASENDGVEESALQRGRTEQFTAFDLIKYFHK